MSRLLSDADDDLPLPQRLGGAQGSARRREAELHEGTQDADREFTLSTGTVLALFFALALVCAVFFGFGYTMGRKSAPAAKQPAEIVSNSSGSDAEEGAEPAKSSAPAAISPATSIPGYMAQSGTGTAAKSSGAAAAVSLKPSAAPVQTRVVVAAAAPKSSPAKPVEQPAPETRPVPAGPPIAMGSGSIYVQVAAVSHKEDADVLLSALRRRGYTVYPRTMDTDKLIHVQVGPFPTKKDAELMRHRLLGDGYNAILK